MPAIRKAQAEDWLEDLAEFGPVIVQQAATDWRRSSTRKPLIADIRSRCIAIQQDRHEQPAFDREAYAKSVGFESWADREAAIERQQEAWRKAEEWRMAQAAKAAT